MRKKYLKKSLRFCGNIQKLKNMSFHMKRILIEGLEINYVQRKVFYKGREIVLMCVH
jgi:hypothetical protein